MNFKENAVSFLNMCAMGEVEKAFSQYVSEDFKHHNQYFAGDRNSLMNAMIDASKTHPNKSFTVQHVYESADKVALYSHVVKDSMEIAVVHMLHFKNGKISEMWDVGQVIDPKSPNKNGMF